MPSDVHTHQELADWLASGEDWRPSPSQPSYRELMRMLGDRAQQVRALRRLAHLRLDVLMDNLPRDPLYEVELKERGLA